MSERDLIDEMYRSIGEHGEFAEDVAHVEIHGNRVLGLQLVEGLEISSEPFDEGLDISISVKEDTLIEHPVRICFGMMQEKGVQKININTDIGRNSKLKVFATCTFPRAEDMVHAMNAEIRVGENSEFGYIERHVHGPEGGINVRPVTRVRLDKGARFSSDFELIKGRVGDLDIEYDVVCMQESTLDISARVRGGGSDRIRINEKAALDGEDATGVLTTNIAVEDEAEADIENTLTASAAGARGHVDCKEIVQDKAVAKAVPVVEVRHPKAHVTHEAAIGSVDSKQLETLMARGLNEDDATDLIIDGLLSH